MLVGIVLVVFGDVSWGDRGQGYLAVPWLLVAIGSPVHVWFLSWSGVWLVGCGDVGSGQHGQAALR